MLPIITEEISFSVTNEAFKDVNVWRKNMVHHLKEQNPEVNAVIINAAQNTQLDPKALALGAYLAYSLLEEAAAEQDKMFSAFNS